MKLKNKKEFGRRKSCY